MVTVVIGGSGSGKSEYAENLTIQSGNKNKFYIATMEPFGVEAEKRIQRHRQLRKDKGFRTIECYRNLEKVHLPKDSSVLLECMSNLVANEMFSDKCHKEEVFETVKTGLECLIRQSQNLVIVTNNVFEDGFLYDNDTLEYMKTLGLVNQWICSLANQVIEVVHGIPIIISSK